MEDMTQFKEIRRVCFVGDYLPRKCGIATFTHDLRCGFAKRFPSLSAIVGAVNDIPTGYAYPKEVRVEFSEQDPMTYERLADYINTNKVDVVCLQHEYGIYGGPCGDMILRVMRTVNCPIVTTLHTILQDPSLQQRKVLNSILALANRIVTMTDKGKSLLQEVYRADVKKIDIVPHGIPELTFGNPNDYKKAVRFEGKRVILTFSLLYPNKGIEYAKLRGKLRGRAQQGRTKLRGRARSCWSNQLTLM